MKVIQAPDRVNWEVPVSIFLAGSIEMGEADNWQEDAIALFDKLLPKAVQKGFQILNPRRDDWNSSWNQTFEDPNFSQQVRWELGCQHRADWILMYFDPNTDSKISLLELGLFHDRSMVVVCPEGYCRKGNVDIVCDIFNIPQKKTLKQAVQHIINSEIL